MTLALRLSMVAPSDYRALSETYFAVLEEHVGTQAITVQVREMAVMRYDWGEARSWLSIRYD